ALQVLEPLRSKLRVRVVGGPTHHRVVDRFGVDLGAAGEGLLDRHLLGLSRAGVRGHLVGDPGLLGVTMDVAHLFSSSSSTTSASTTSSSPVSPDAPASEAPAASPVGACSAAAAYTAAPIFCDSVLRASILALMSAAEAPESALRASLSSSRAVSTGVLRSSETLSPLSARNFSVESGRA